MRTCSVAGLSLWLGLASGVQAGEDDPINAASSAPVAELLGQLDEDVRQYDAHIMTLSNPFFEGRAPGTRGNELAAEYIEFWYRKIGLAPAFPDADDTPNASYRQSFSAPSELKVTQERLTIGVDGRMLELTPGVDFNTLGYAGNGEASGSLAFVGYSIDEGGDGYSSYDEDTDLEGKIVIMLRFEPFNEQGTSQWTDASGPKWSPNAGLMGKFKAAAARGASAIIFVCPPGVDDDRCGRLEDARSTRARGPMRQEIPVVMISQDAADELLKSADAKGRSLADLTSLANENGGVIDLPGASVEVVTRIEKLEVLTDNIGGILAGKGNLADEYVIVGGHYDHVGYGYFGSVSGSVGQLHPGGDDNASGTSGVIMAAQWLKQRYDNLPDGANARSILFMGFSAEESGLNGSKYYTQHPTLQPSEIALMINMDMIGRLREGHVQLGGVGTADGLETWLEPMLADSGLDIGMQKSGTGPSDHASFYRYGVPVLFFFTGTHDDYHTPGDMGWKVNRVGAIQVARLVTRVAEAAADRTEGFDFTPTSDPQARRGPGRGSIKVRFGIRPGSYDDESGGVLVEGVSEDGSADLAGIQDGDVLLKWNGKTIGSVQAWMPMLAAHKPGDEVVVTILHDGKKIDKTVTLQAPKGTR